MEDHKDHPRHSVTLWHNGNGYHGSYTVHGQRVTVYLGTAAISGVLPPHSGVSPLSFASSLLKELVLKKK